MKKLLRLMSYILVAALASAATLAVTFEPGEKYDKLDELRYLIDERFIGDIDWKVAEDYAAAGMIEGLGDRWSYYMSAESFESYKEQMSNAYVGVGITVTEREDHYLDILEVVDNGPAAQAGVEPGGVVIRVGDQDVSEVGINGATTLIKGEEGTDVTMTIRYGEEEKDFTMTRAYFEVTVAWGQMLEDGIGLVAIAVIVAGAYLLAPGTPAVGYLGEPVSDGALKLTDTVLNLTYLLMGASLVALVAGWIIGATRK